jgi:hypothetical protein
MNDRGDVGVQFVDDVFRCFGGGDQGGVSSGAAADMPLKYRYHVRYRVAFAT